MRSPEADSPARLLASRAGRDASLVPPAEVPAACDVLVVGGGINGVGIARDLAGRGLQVVLAEREDLAQHTSSASTKLIHGGLRYLEYYEFSLVRKALAEREGLLRGAPHIMRPLRIVMPHDPSMRPAWMLRAGLFLYDHLARREMLPGSHAVDLRRDVTGRALKSHYTKGFVYSDGWVDDARLVALCAVDAAARGATVLTRCAVTAASRGNDGGRNGTGWIATLQDADGVTRQVRARALVNAAGPWASAFLRDHAQLKGVRSLRLVKGSHIVVPKLFDHDHAYIFQNPDKRIIFVQPYEGDYTLIGTTDVEHHGAIGAARIDEDEVRYLCEQASRYFAQPIKPTDVVWSYAGVRPLIDDESSDAAAVTRDYLLELDTHGAPLLNVWGGKLTTFRLLGEEAADLLSGALGTSGRAWTRGAVLPGGDLSAFIGAPTRHSRPDADLQRFVQVLQQRLPGLPADVLQRWARHYGSRIELLLEGNDGQPGPLIATGVYEAELVYLVKHEWARGADDILWRRTKLGLHLDDAQRARIAAWCDDHVGAPVRAPQTVERAWN